MNIPPTSKDNPDKPMTFSVATVTTAFNARQFLPRQMDALKRQTRPLQEMVVVDNG